MNDFGLNTWKKITPTTIKTQFIGVDQDPAASNDRIRSAVGRLRNESANILNHFPESQRKDDDGTVQICYMPKDTNHSLLSRFDSPQEDKYWINGLLNVIVDFIIDGKFAPANPNKRYEGDPSCLFEGMKS